jgi:2,3-bisphosphoglycerate-dependent phosphoglycerate mutase
MRDTIGPVIHIFTSNLQRAYFTAQAIADAQPVVASNSVEGDSSLSVVQLPELREKDFGSAEGARYGALSTGRADGSIQPDSETRDAMMVRVNRFIDIELESILEAHASEKVAVAVVAHGLILGVLLQALTTRFPASAALATLPNPDGSGAAWSNTGILQAKVERISVTPAPSINTAQPELPTRLVAEHMVTNSSSDHIRLTLTVQTINSTDHLTGLKKTRGGIGSARFDARQQSLTAFFTPTPKKRKAEDHAH